LICENDSRSSIHKLIVKFSSLNCRRKVINARNRSLSKESPLIKIIIYVFNPSTAIKKESVQRKDKVNTSKHRMREKIKFRKLIYS